MGSGRFAFDGSDTVSIGALEGGSSSKGGPPEVADSRETLQQLAQTDRTELEGTTQKADQRKSAADVETNSVQEKPQQEQKRPVQPKVIISWKVMIANNADIDFRSNFSFMSIRCEEQDEVPPEETLAQNSF